MQLNNLQILRGISALLVCCFHFKEVLNFGGNSWGEMLFKNGSIGVPTFFVISGYIMVFSTKKIAHTNVLQNILAFFKKRVMRIVPLYYLLTFAWMVFSGSLIYFLNFGETTRLPKSLLFLPLKNEFPILYLGWSLNYEMFFYFIFAVSLLFKKFRYIFTILLFCVLIALGLIFSFENSFLKMLGDISYSIYLSHPFVEIFFRRFQTESPAIIMLFIIKLAVVILISKLLYEVVEKRFTNYLKNNFIPYLK